MSFALGLLVGLVVGAILGVMSAVRTMAENMATLRTLFDSGEWMRGLDIARKGGVGRSRIYARLAFLERVGFVESRGTIPSHHDLVPREYRIKAVSR